jgi:excisionase family DNA binding protein
MANAQPPHAEASGAPAPQLFGEGTGLEDVSFLTVAEVAGLMRVSKMTVYRMVHSGELTAVRVGRSFRVPSKAVREYLSGAYVGTE